jgi:mono/diheme cytochrome c family protein
MGKYLKHPLGQAGLVLLVAYVLLDFGIAYIPPLLGFPSAPIPNSVLLQYLITVSVGILLWVSDNEARWAEFKAPMHQVMVDPERKRMRNSLMVLVPLFVAFMTFNQVLPSVAAPTSLRSIHPAPPGQIDFQGTAMELATLENPLRSQGSMEEHYEEGKRVYYQNCLACHGDGLDGQGHYAQGFNPTPLNFQDIGTIAQLTESFVFWRIAKGGPGLPNEGGPWNSAMPAWEDFLTEDEIWAVIIFLYEQTGHEPRTFEEEGGEGEEH